MAVSKNNPYGLPDWMKTHPYYSKYFSSYFKEDKKVKKKKVKKKKTLKTKYKNGEVFNCVWDLWISGTKLAWNKKQYISSISIKETVDGSDSATVVVSDPDFLFLEDNIFIEANTIKIKMGWTGYKYRCKFTGYISHVDIEFPEDGVPKLTLSCMDNTYIMDREKRSETYTDTDNASIVKKICMRYGFKCVVDSDYSFATQESISQNNQTDIAFIQQLAQNEVHPFTARLVNDTFYYQRKGIIKNKAKIALTYKNYPYDIISFNPKINKVSKNKIQDGNTIVDTKSAEESMVSDHYTGTPAVSSGVTESNTSSDSSGGSSVTTSGNSTNNSSSTKSGKTVSYDKNSRTWS